MSFSGRRLDLSGDAIFCQRDLSRQVVEAQGDYLLKVDKNQPNLQADIALAFEPGFSPLASRQE